MLVVSQQNLPNLTPHALFFRMETINKQMEMNEVRILAVEIRMKMPNKADENVEEKPKTFTSKHKTIYCGPRFLLAVVLCRS